MAENATQFQGLNLYVCFSSPLVRKQPVPHCAQLCHGPLVRYVKLRVAHAPGIPGTFFPPPRVSDLDMHHGTCVTHVPWYMLGSLTNGFLWSRWWEKRSRHCRRMRNPQRYVSGKRPISKRKYQCLFSIREAIQLKSSSMMVREISHVKRNCFGIYFNCNQFK